jgi:hypothetical protein
MARAEDFAICYAEDVRWTTFDGGTTVLGLTKERDYLMALHRSMPDIQTRPLAYAAKTAYVEGDCADPRSASTGRIAFTAAYDVANGGLTRSNTFLPPPAADLSD